MASRDAATIAVALAKTVRLWTPEMWHVVTEALGVGSGLVFVHARSAPSLENDALVGELGAALNYLALEMDLLSVRLGPKGERPKEHPSVRADVRRVAELEKSGTISAAQAREALGQLRCLLVFSVPKEDGRWHNAIIGAK